MGEVQTNRIPTEGLKLAPRGIAGRRQLVQTNRIPTEGLKLHLNPNDITSQRVQTNRIPTEGLKRHMLLQFDLLASGPNQQNPDRGIETTAS